MVLAAVNTLINFAVAHVDDAPQTEQIEVYLALAETLPDAGARARARELAKTISQAAALQLEFKAIVNAGN